MQSRITSTRQRSHPEGLSKGDLRPLTRARPFCFAAIEDCAIYRVFMATGCGAENADSKRDWWTRYSRNRESYRAVAQRICDQRIGIDGAPFRIVTD